VAVSTVEDVATTGLLYLAYSHPLAAGLVAAVLLVLTVTLMVVAWRVLRRVFLRVQGEPVHTPAIEA
jgi:hypothetical protein